jgi:hypothetical protein
VVCIVASVSARWCDRPEQRDRGAAGANQARKRSATCDVLAGGGQRVIAIGKRGAARIDSSMRSRRRARDSSA